MKAGRGFMKSHTVPKKLLKNFAYDDPVTGSKRLWRYRKGMAPHGNATPKTATRWDGHFADPANTAKEAELETRLEREFEHPVNQFLDFIGYSTFFWEAKHIRALTGYVTMLFTRSRARRRASQIQADLMIEAMRSVVADEKKLSALISKHQVDAFWAGLDPKLVTRKVVIEVIENRIREASTPDNGQRQYINSMETMMRFSDLHLLNGQWGVIPADNGKRFVIGDAPVVTWVRTENNMLNFGQGFARPTWRHSCLCRQWLAFAYSRTFSGRVPRCGRPRTKSTWRKRRSRQSIASRTFGMKR